MPKSRKPMTAAELLRDPEFQKKQAATEAWMGKNAAMYQRAAAGLLADLRAIGFAVDSVGDLRHHRIVFAEAVPVLIAWLPKVTYEPLKEDIIRTLSVPWASPEAARPLIEEFHRLPPEPAAMRWAVGNALEVIADDSVFEEVLAIATDPSYGRAREMFVGALGNMTNPRAKEILLELLREEAVAPYAVMGLGKLGAEDVRPLIEPFTEHPEEWVRKEAKTALRRIDRRRG